MKEVPVCDQCASVTRGYERPCPATPGCKLSFCISCSDMGSHIREDGTCSPGWRASLTEEQIEQELARAAEKSAEAWI